MIDPSTPVDPGVVLDLILAFRRSKTMFAAVRLGVFDALSAGPASLTTLADSLKCNRDALERLLSACVGLKLLRYRPVGHAYENTPAAAAYLCQTSDRRITGYINFSNDIFWKLWGNLEGAMREGTSRWKETFGWDGPMWENIFRTPEQQREFLMGMHGYGEITSPHVVETFNLGKFHSLVDLGGGTGHLAIAACRKYQHLRATVFDLPEVVKLTREVVNTSAPDVKNRITVVSGDFFENALPKGDLYVVARTLHDWPEHKVKNLMETVAAAVPDHGAFLIAEKMLTEDKTGPDWAAMQNLNMLVCAEGKERTAAEYRRLLTAAGFRQVEAQRTMWPLDVILAYKQAGNPEPTRSTIKLRENEFVEQILPPPASFVELAQRYCAFVENTRIGCVITDMDGNFLLVNRAFSEIHGHTVQQTLEMNYKHLTPKGYETDDRIQIAELQRKRRFGPFDKEYLHADGTLVAVRVTLELIKVDGKDCLWAIVEKIGDDDLVQASPPG